MCNVYLHRLDRAWDEHDGVLVRYADDLVVMCWSRSQAERALERLTAVLAGLGLEPKAAKTRIVHLQVGGEGFDFLGFHHRLVRSRGLNGKKPVTFLARWPSDKAMQHARDRIRELTRRSRLLLPQKWIVEDLNRFLGGWAAYFRFGNSAARFGRSGTTRGCGWRCSSANATAAPGGSAGRWSPTSPRTSSGWSPCQESSLTPGPSGTGGQGRMPAVNGVGEPCAGEPHARFDAAGAGNGATWPWALGWRNRPGNRRHTKAPGPTVRTRHRASPRPYVILGWWPEAVAGCLFPACGRAWRPGCRAGWAGFHGPAGCPFWSQGLVAAGQPGARACSRVIAVVIWLAQGQRGGEAEPQAAAAADEAPGGGEDPQPQPLGFPAAGGAGAGRASASRRAVRRPARRSRTRSGSGRSRAGAGCAGRCPWRSGSGPRTGPGGGGAAPGRRAARPWCWWRSR